LDFQKLTESKRKHAKAWSTEDEVLKSSKISSAISEKSTSEELRKWLEGLSDEDPGRYNPTFPF
jgi:hypothetical protein